MELTAQAKEALALLWEKDWFAQTTPRPEVENTDQGGCTVWCENEAYRIAPDGSVFRVSVRYGEVVFVD